MERVPPQGASGACGGPCFCVVFAFLAWPCTGSPKVPSGKETATLCPLDWPSNYSLLRLWHTNGSLHQTEARLRNQLSHSHMFAEWTVHLPRFAERVLFQQPAVYVAGHALQTNLRERNFPDRKVRRRVPPTDLDDHQRAIQSASAACRCPTKREPSFVWAHQRMARHYYIR